MGALTTYLTRIVPLALVVGWLGIAGLISLLVTVVMMSTAHADTLPVAGVIVSSVGDTSLSRTGQITSPAGRLQEIYVGDRLLTGSNGQISLRFTDGMRMNIGPASQLNVDDYLHDPKGDRGWFDLLRGSLRTVTGLIGKRSPRSFRLRTPTAVIGVRGTDFSVVQRDCHAGDCSKPELGAMEVSVAKGAVDVANKAGQVRINAGQTARIDNLGAKPMLVAAPALVVPKRSVPMPRKPTRESRPRQTGEAGPAATNAVRDDGPRLPIDAPGTDEFLAQQPR